MARVKAQVPECKALFMLARPGRFELPTLCLEAPQCKTLSPASGVAYEGARYLSRP
jgi:hypothetical protein